MINAVNVLLLATLAFSEPGVVTRGPFRQSLILTGKLTTSGSEMILTPPAWGRSQLKWLIEEGQEVQPGDLVAVLENEDLRRYQEDWEGDLEDKQKSREGERTSGAAKIAGLKEALRAAEIELEKAKVDASVPEDVQPAKDYKEAQYVLMEKEVAFQEAGAELEAEIKKYENQMKIFDREIESLHSRLTSIRELTAGLELRAGTAGSVLYQEYQGEGRKVQEGDNLFTGNPILEIPNVATLQVEAYVWESDYPALREGLAVTIILDGYPERPFSGRVVRLGHSGETREKWGELPFFTVLIDFDQPDTSVMRPGMSVRAEVLVMENENALLVPVTHLLLRESRFMVAVDGEEQPVEVEVLGMNAFHAAIAPGNGVGEGTRLRSPRGEEVR